MKTCCDCNIAKPFSEFVPKKSCKGGYEPRCRVCRSIRYNKADPLKAFRKIYLSQVEHSITRGHPAPAYTFEEMLDWVDTQPHAVALWNAYLASGYNTKLRPSIDRKDDALPYMLSNLQLMTWDQNRSKGAQSKQAGLVNAQQRPVAAFNRDGTLHKQYVSIMDAVRDVDGRMWGVASVANGVQIKDGRGKPYTPKTYKGFVWKWI